MIDSIDFILISNIESGTNLRKVDSWLQKNGKSSIDVFMSVSCYNNLVSVGAIPEKFHVTFFEQDVTFIVNKTINILPLNSGFKLLGIVYSNNLTDEDVKISSNDIVIASAIVSVQATEKKK